MQAHLDERAQDPPPGRGCAELRHCTVALGAVHLRLLLLEQLLHLGLVVLLQDAPLVGQLAPLLLRPSLATRAAVHPGQHPHRVAACMQPYEHSRRRVKQPPAPSALSTLHPVAGLAGQGGQPWLAGWTPAVSRSPPGLLAQSLRPAPNRKASYSCPALPKKATLPADSTSIWSSSPMV